MSCDLLFPGVFQSEIPTSPNEKDAASKTIYVGNLSFYVERADMYVHFLADTFLRFSVIFF